MSDNEPRDNRTMRPEGSDLSEARNLADDPNPVDASDEAAQSVIRQSTSMPRHDSTEDIAAGVIAFLCGADMMPEETRARPELEDAEFISIARVHGAHGQRLGLPAALIDERPSSPGPPGAIWGIALRLPLIEDEANRLRGEVVPVTLRDGTELEGTLATTAESVGAPADVLAAARYWELPGDYRDRLEAAL